MNKTLATVILFVLVTAHAQETGTGQGSRVKTANGILQGVEESGITSFKGVPFAAPPVGELRWKEPQPVRNWTGVRQADRFGPQPMQRPLFGDLGSRSAGMSEDCLYLNVWTPARSATERLPVLVYFHGGGMMAGDGSEPRYDGENMSRKGIVAITVNYRLTIFGFLAHPELTKESPHHASGNYGLLDQVAALQWVKRNISAFGGDPRRITIGGESAGSFSVSALMASPLSKNLIAAAIGESGSMLGKEAAISLADAEHDGVNFAAQAGAKSLAELRKMSAQQLLEVTARHEWGDYNSVVDGYFFPQSPLQIYAAGEQAHVPLLVGWNAEESNYHTIFGQDKPSQDSFNKAVKKIYGGHADGMLKVYSPATDKDVMQVATALASDLFIGFSTWKWSDLQASTGGKPVYRYLYARSRPVMRAELGNATAGLAGGVIKNDDPTVIKAPTSSGAVHAAEIEYALGNLPTNRVYDWQLQDFRVSEIMQAFFVNFIKTGDPNGLGSAQWPAVIKDRPAAVMRIDVKSGAEIEKHRDRYLYMDKAPYPNWTGP
jgi:para-nitrobenzyl esterase